MRNRSPGKTDIICLCNWHALGGAQLNAELLVAEFERRGYRAILGFLFERDPEAQHSTDSYFIVSPRAPTSPVEWQRFIARCVREVVDRRPRAIIGFQPWSNIVGAMAASRTGDCRMIATQRNPSDRQSAKVGFLERLVGLTRLYDANIAVSETVAASFDRYPAGYKRKLQVVHNATPSLAEVSDDRAACRLRFGMPEDVQVLGCLGRLHPQKNVSLALDVLAALSDSVLFLAGGGPQEAELRARAKTLGVAERVTFVGAINGSDITRFYRALDVLLFPSIYEGFGRVLVEAMSQGVPVVASDLPVVREVGGGAVLLRPFEVQEWVKAVSALRSDPLLVSQLAAQGRERSAAFSLSAMVDGYLAAAGLGDRPARPQEAP